MPMDFPDMKSLIMAAEVHKFRKPKKGESEDAYRNALADHVRPRDLIESQEIRHKVGWDLWGDKEEKDLLQRNRSEWRP